MIGSDGRRSVGALLVAALLVTAGLGIGVAGAAAQDAPEEAFVVELEESGDATATLIVTYDLDDDDESTTFEQLQERELAAQYEDRLRQIANRTAAETGREMRVTEPRATVETVDDVGVVRLSVRWEGLAAVDGDRLIVDEPFASGFKPDRPLVLVAPDGYAVGETTVPPTDTADGVARWPAGESLSGFQATFGPGDGSGDSGLSTPTPLVPTLGLLTAAALGYATRRRLA